MSIRTSVKKIPIVPAPSGKEGIAMEIRLIAIDGSKVEIAVTGLDQDHHQFTESREPVNKVPDLLQYLTEAGWRFHEEARKMWEQE